MSVVRCTRAAVPLMRKAGWGRVINISSISARVGQSFEAPYMTAKAGLNALSKNMAWALAKRRHLGQHRDAGCISNGGAARLHGNDGRNRDLQSG